MQMHANQREDVDEVGAGGIAAMGLKITTTGDTLCDAAGARSSSSRSRSRSR